MEIIEYDSSIGKQMFISYRTVEDDKICGFLRLSLPDKELVNEHFMNELSNKAMIREVHVYGQVVGIGKQKDGRSQHLGLGTKMIDKACEIAAEHGFDQINVISAIGTKKYYSKKGFVEDGMYMVRCTE